MTMKEIKEGTKRSDAEDNIRDGSVNLPKIERERATEEQQCNLQHRWQRLHHTVKVPRNSSVKFPPSTLAAFDRRPSHVGRTVALQPLLAKHRQAGGQDRSGKTRVEDGLGMNHCGRRPGPLWEGGNIASESSVVERVYEDPEESGGLVA